MVRYKFYFEIYVIILIYIINRIRANFPAWLLATFFLEIWRLETEDS